MIAAHLSWLGAYAYAHRGLWRAHGAPENSLAAFEAAHRHGLGAELDVRVSADGEAIVFHDSSLERMTGERGYTSAWTSAELARLRLLDSDEHVPTLFEALEALAGAPVLVELKVNPGSEGPLERRVAYILSHYDGPHAVMSFNASSLSEIAHQSPETPRGQLCEGWPRGQKPLFPWAQRAAVQEFVRDQVPVDFLACDVRALATFGRPAANALRLPLVAWTVRNRSLLERAERHADALIFEHLEPALVKPPQHAYA